MLSINSNADLIARAIEAIQAEVNNDFTIGVRNNIAFRVQKSLRGELQLKIDRPTPFTIRGGGGSPVLKVFKANKRFGQAKVFTGQKQSDYLGFHVFGGTRRGKAMNVPAKIKKNKFGNIPRTRDGRVKIRRPKTVKSVFVGSPRNRPGGPGIWLRRQKGKARWLTKVVTFAAAMKYKKQLLWFDLAQKTFDDNAATAVVEVLDFLSEREKKKAERRR